MKAAIITLITPVFMWFTDKPEGFKDFITRVILTVTVSPILILLCLFFYLIFGYSRLVS